jgi:uncharacterized repeat protein (TIGR03803 family)
VVFKLDTTGHETVLHSFTDGADGGVPVAGVIGDLAGNLYGTTVYGGAWNHGVVYKLSTTGHEIVLYSFPGSPGGGHPRAGVMRDSVGNLYGSTYDGGPSNAGAVYKLDGTGHLTALHSFTGGVDGGNPWAGVIQDPAGKLYGTTVYGGASNQGVVYRLDTRGSETVLYSFTGGADGGSPYAGVILDSAGNLYGTTQFGGASNQGVVYRLDAAANETVLYSFSGGADGGHPLAGVILDAAGNLYGTTYNGGTSNTGVVYMVDTTGHETVLHSFTGGADGINPRAGVIRDSAGNCTGLPTLAALLVRVWCTSWILWAMRRCCIASRVARTGAYLLREWSRI